MTIYKAIAAVQADLAKGGIGKERRNDQQGYAFRGIDDVYNALAPLLSQHGLCILPRITARECVERVNSKGNALFYVTVEAEFDFVSSDDGSKHTVKTFGEAMDSGDKATNKAMSAAYKYAAFQTFCIPTEGDNDADNTSHEVKPRTTSASTAPASADEKAAGYHERIRGALRQLFGADKAAALAHVEKLSTWMDKKTGEIKAAGVKDYRNLTGKRLEILCDTLEREAKRQAPPPAVSRTIDDCLSCGGPLEQGECHNLECPDGVPF